MTEIEKTFQTFDQNLKTNKNNDAVVLGLSIACFLLAGGLIAFAVLYFMKKCPDCPDCPDCDSCCKYNNHYAECDPSDPNNPDKDCYGSHLHCIQFKGDTKHRCGCQQTANKDGWEWSPSGSPPDKKFCWKKPTKK